jgi:hypothetical protein
VAARTKLTPELRVVVERELAAGVPVAVAAQRAGVGRRTLQRWLARGLVVRRQLAPAAAPRKSAVIARSRRMRATGRHALGR